jgi:hypothetical protein
MATSSLSTDLLSVSTLVASGKNRLNALSIIGDGTNAGTVTIYDNTTNSGKIVAQGLTRTSDVQQHIIWTYPVVVEKGIYVTITGTNCKAIVYYGA